eukprot:TRINITY_DN79279_c0_g1_i1.p2 TRINITY_DN79279_c0_g1~~TRINITY_DN79279_c0_g1_i1.p2  ORF type:complete len:189 (-),score=40.31 TRINITY_DN79279_c0_g1_i1:475-1041(-)
MVRKVLSAVVVALLGSSNANGVSEPPMQCPGTGHGVWFHAKASLLVTAKTSCSIVQDEIRARVKGENGWVDPHNHGTYSMISDQGGAMKLKRVTGNGKYTDMMVLTFAGLEEDSSCQIAACSESQVNSWLDMSTNFCNLHNLYCGKQDGCPIAVQDIGEYKEELRSMSSGAGHDKGKCVVKKDKDLVV